MKVKIYPNPDKLGQSAARHSADCIRSAIEKNGEARIVLSTGASQFDTIKHLVREDVDWSRVTMFHLDEYVGLDETHIASFRKYLKERFTAFVPLKAAHFVDGNPASIPSLTALLREAPIDLGLIGIGENAHIAFNDPPADFDTREAYIVVTLNAACRKQQVGEGWFVDADHVPEQAISMTPYQIMQCKTILSCVPYPVKANAVRLTLENELSSEVPATLLKTHPDFTLYADADSAALVNEEMARAHCQRFEGYEIY